MAFSPHRRSEHTIVVFTNLLSHFVSPIWWGAKGANVMLVDFVIESIHRGTARAEAIVSTTKNRARPIIMTSVAMIAGMLPSALAFGAGGEFRSPMAIAVIGGLTVSTALSLLFVPALFVIVDDFGWFLWTLFGRFVGKSDEPPVANL